jgi:heat shock protein HslJ
VKRWFLLLLMFILSACVQTQSELANTRWLLTSYGPASTRKEVLPNAPVTLSVDKTGNQASGSSGCNSYGGELTVRSNTLTMKNVVSTLIACTEPGIAEQERDYFDLLQRVTTFEKTATTLTLSVGEERLEFISQ